MTLTHEEQTLLAGYRALDAVTQARVLAFVQVSPEPPNIIAVPDAPHSPDTDAHQRLLTRLKSLGTEGLDSMNDDTWGDWIDALPQDEFFALVALDHQAKMGDPLA